MNHYAIENGDGTTTVFVHVKPYMEENSLGVPCDEHLDLGHSVYFETESNLYVSPPSVIQGLNGFPQGWYELRYVTADYDISRQTEIISGRYLGGKKPTGLNHTR